MATLHMAPSRSPIDRRGPATTRSSLLGTLSRYEGVCHVMSLMGAIEDAGAR
jgi:hypothetical protein